MRGMTVLVPILLAAAAVACDAGPAEVYPEFSKIELLPLGHDVTVDSSGALVFHVVDVGNHVQLCLSGIRLDYTPVTDAEKAGVPAFTLTIGEAGTVTPVPTPAAPLCLAPMNEGWGTLPESLRVVVAATRYPDTQARLATLHVFNDNTDDPALQDYQVRFHFAACLPSLDDDGPVDLGEVATGQTRSVDFPLVNTGNCPVTITGALLAGDASISVDAGGTPLTTTGGRATFQPPITVPADPSRNHVTWTARFAPQAAGPAAATLTIFSDDPRSPEGRLVSLTGTVP